jgi:flagellar biosynthesis/type III secretory pathway protein FliH
MSALRIEIVKHAGRTRPLDRAHMGPLISHRRREAELEAARIVEDALRVAASIEADARAEANAVRRAAAAEGREEGERRWTEAALALADARVEDVDAIERNVVRLALEVARHVVGDALASDPRRAVDLVARACAGLRRDASLVLRISAANADRAEAIRERLGDRGAVLVETDASLDDGECVAECAGVRVDATLDAQLEAIRRRLLDDGVAR